MFEQISVSTMLGRRLGRAISIVMSVAMLVTALPADLLGGILSVKAAPDAGTATVLNVSDMTKGKVPAGVMNGSIFSAKNDSMSVVEDTQTFDGKNFTQSLKLTANSAITFNAVKGDTLKIYAMADDVQAVGTGTNPDGKEDADGTQTAKSATKLTVTGEEPGSADDRARDNQSMNLTKTLAVETLELAVSGSYTLTADGEAKVFYLELSGAEQPGANVKTNTYVFNATDLTIPEADKTVIAAGTKLGTEGYFKVTATSVTPEGESTAVDGQVVIRTNKAVDKITSIELEKSESAGFQFEVRGSAIAEFKVCSTGGSNASRVALVDVKTGKYVKPSDKSDIKTGKDTTRGEDVEANGVQADNSVLLYGNSSAASTLVFEGLEAGTYAIVSPYHKVLNRGVQLVSAKVEDSVQVQVTTKEYTFNATDLTIPEADKTVIAAGTKLGTEGYFKVTATSVTPEGESTAVDGQVVIRTNKAVDKITSIELEKSESAGFQFEVRGSATAEFKVCSTGGSNASRVALVDVKTGKYVKPSDKSDIKTGKDTTRGEDVEANGVQADNSVLLYGNSSAASTLVFEGLEAGTYAIVSPYHKVLNRGVQLVSAKVSDTFIDAGADSRPAWGDVAAPTIVKAVQTKDDVIVTVNGVIGRNGADTIFVERLEKQEDGTFKAVEKVITANDADGDMDLKFTPTASGTYYYRATATRDGEEDKVGAVSAAFAYVLPLKKPLFKHATNMGKGVVMVGWSPVDEAVSYNISYKENVEGAVESQPVAVTPELDTDSGDDWAYNIQLEVDKTYTIYVQAVRGSNDVSEKGSIEVVVRDRVERIWAFAAYGASTSLSNATYNIINEKGEVVPTTTPANGYKGNANDKEVQVWSQNGKGKLVPASTDGLAFYYTQVDPINDNFVLKAKVHVDAWSYSNGQDGFGLMVADRVGANGDTTDPFWNNSYMAAVTKIEYRWNKEAGELTTDPEIGSTSMKLGVGTIARTGAPAGWSSPNLPEKFTTTTTTLEYSCNQFGPGTYNIVGNRTNPDSTDQNVLYTDFNLIIERNNTGYTLTYLDQEGKVIESKTYYDEKYFDENGNYTGTYDAPGQNGTLMQMDPKSISVGFFAARNATATFSDIEMTVTDARKDAPAEERVKVLVDPSYSIASASNANSENYDMQFYSIVPGYVTIQRADGSYVANNVRIENEKTKLHFAETLKKGKNTYTWTMTPDKDYEIGGKGSNTFLKDYNVRSETFTVTYETFGNKYIYVSPDATAKGKGTAEDPVDIATAVKYIRAGQTILLDGGTYNLTSSLSISRGISGTAEEPIRMIADPSSKERPVIDFGKNYKTGMKLSGDYWILQGFDVTNSGDGTDGLQVCGNHNVLDSLRTYGNGNTGIQLSRLSGSDTTQADWPSYNLVKNCTSYCNADSGYEDADGFAAKLTVGPGNVFDGCIAAYNADDGWDLFAKVEHGPIGKVTIKNSIAYGNGYVIGPNGEKIEAGNGNGFKMGGSSVTGYHTLINSIAFDNKAKGIDSNSCPDIQVENCISFNNGSYNVALYTGAGVVNTDYSAQGVISFRTEKLGQKEQLNGKGTQDESKIYNDTNFFWEVIDEEDETKNVSQNKSGVKVTADWFANLEAPAFGTIVGRHADGTIDLGDFLKLTDKAIAGIGAKDLDANGEKSDYLTEDKLANEKSQLVSKGMVIDEIKDQTYTGQPIKPTLTISNGLTYLKKSDYTVTYRDNKNVGTATVTIRGKGNYTETITTTFKIVKKNLGDSDVTLQNKVLALKASNREQKPKPVVLWKKKKLAMNKDYEVAYFAEADYIANGEKATALSGVTDAGRYVMQIKGINNMEGTILETVVVTDAAHMISRANVKLSTKIMQATGAQVEFIADKDNAARNITVKMGQTELTYGTDFELDYENNVLPGKATVIVRGKGDYAGEKKVNFTIRGIDIRRATVTGIPTSPTVYAGEAVTLSGLTITIPNTDPATKTERPQITLVSGTDFTVSYKNNTRAGSAQIIFTGTGMYSGKLSRNFRIAAADITQEYDASVIEGDKGHIIVEGLEADYEKGNTKLSNLTVKYYDDDSKKTFFLQEGKDYTVTYVRNTAAGVGVMNNKTTPHIIITGRGGFSGRLYKWITIKPKDLNTAKIVNRVKKEIVVDVKDMAASTRRNGWKSKVVVTDLNNKRMSLNTDYTVAYQYAEGEKAGQTVADTDQPEIGTKINVVIKAGTNGNYTGEKTVTYQIYDPEKDIKSARINVDMSKPILYTGETITLSDVARTYPGDSFPITITAKDGKALVYGQDYEVVSGTYSKNLFKGTAKVTIRGINGYGGTKVLTYKISPKPLKKADIL